MESSPDGGVVDLNKDRLVEGGVTAMGLVEGGMAALGDGWLVEGGVATTVVDGGIAAMGDAWLMDGGVAAQGDDWLVEGADVSTIIISSCANSAVLNSCRASDSTLLHSHTLYNNKRWIIIAFCLLP